MSTSRFSVAAAGAAALIVAGPFGGHLSHAAEAAAGPVEERTVYDAVIAPIMAARCTSCHGPEKQKGKLQQHTLEQMLKAGDSGKPAFVPGKSAESESIRRIGLAADDDDHMPPKDKPQPTADEIEVLKWWIDAGAKGDVKVKDAGLADPLKGKVLAIAAAPPPVPKPEPAPAPVPAATAASAPKDEKISALEKELGIVILPLAQNDPALSFNCVNVADKFGDAELAKFAPLADRFAEVNLSRSKVTDAGLSSLSGMKNLKRLHLQNTAVTDAGVDHLAPLGTLEYLNLFNTKVTDAALPKLEKLGALKKLYVWQTAVTKPAAEALHGKLPNIVINLGWDSEVKTAAAPPPPPPPAPAPTAAAGPVDPEKPLFEGLVAPILAAKCTGCHGTEKQKGKLQMHTLELLLKGGDSGEKTVVAGKSAESLIIKRTSLPKDSDEHMPPEDKPQLTDKEMKTLKWWIDNGAKSDVKIKDAGLPDDLK